MSKRLDNARAAFPPLSPLPPAQSAPARTFRALARTIRTKA
jgi:hypothetical protein